MTPQEREAAQMALDAIEKHLRHHEHGCAYLDGIPEALRAALATEQKPVAWYDVEHGEAETVFSSQRPPWEGDWKPLYAAPPQREWQGLTDEEFSHGIQMASNTSWMKAAKWVEAKLKEKNESPK